MTIPLEEGFTVVTGPNGSGKSNILDGILFCLGLATSKGMRADRLPDLVNSAVLRAGKAAETVVSVRFDLNDWEPDLAEQDLEPPEEGPWIKPGQKEWTVTRRLRVMPGGSYSSTYSADGEICNLQQLQTQLRRIRVDPEGSNVVMQGDVTRIVSMSNKDRRGLIDELAGIALFDNRIDQARSKLDDVYEKQERCRIVEQELLASKQRLQKDSEKARLYKELKNEFQICRQQESVLAFEEASNVLSDLKSRKNDFLSKQKLQESNLVQEEKKLNESLDLYKLLQKEVKDLGEDKLIAVQAEIAGLDSQSRELERQALQHKEEGEKLKIKRSELIKRKNEVKVSTRDNEEKDFASKIKLAEQKCIEAESVVEASRRQFSDLAGQSGVLVEKQRERSIRRQNLTIRLKPLQQEQQKLEERLDQINLRLDELYIDQNKDNSEDKSIQLELEKLENEWELLLQEISELKNHIDKIFEDIHVQTRTRKRLENDQVRIEKEIARLESRRETIQESRGTGALRLLLKSGLEGIHGPVAQLGEVNNDHRLALEVAAGSRIGQIVVDDDQIASRSIHLLKTKKAGRLTFLPLNKIRSPKFLSKDRTSSNALERSIPGLIGKAVDLIHFDSIYKNVFAYVFGETLVFDQINNARNYLGSYRSVTLGGDLLEKSGAMTGGSFLGRSSGLTFGSSKESDDIEPLRTRLLEIGETLIECRKEEAYMEKSLAEMRPRLGKLEQKQASLDAKRSAFKKSNLPLLSRLKERTNRLDSLQETKNEHTQRLIQINKEINPLLIDLEKLESQEKVSQNDQHSKTLQKLEKCLQEADEDLEIRRLERDNIINKNRETELLIQRLNDQEASLINEERILEESINTLTSQHKEWRSLNDALIEKRARLQEEKKILDTAFGEKRRARDKAEADLGNQRQLFQKMQWQLEKLKEDIISLEEELRSGILRLQELENNLPDPIPEVPDSVRNNGLSFIQDQLQNLQNRLEALEPVNMLALEELEKLEIRLNELVNRLEVLTEERSELLLRVENVSTLRQDAFMEAFKAVDFHFREIFARLSDGDGHLQLDNSEDPLDGGLTLVAHPKGKSVRRLAAMSGGEKSLTALSFLFALQRFRPSPFYALDEVDSFLDGVNVERLSALIASQSDQAQFLVVSHRRPMIGAASRTIGVTQARGSHTQVVGLPTAA